MENNANFKYLLFFNFNLQGKIFKLVEEDSNYIDHHLILLLLHYYHKILLLMLIKINIFLLILRFLIIAYNSRDLFNFMRNSRNYYFLTLDHLIGRQKALTDIYCLEIAQFLVLFHATNDLWDCIHIIYLKYT